MARPKTVTNDISGRDRTKDIPAFSLEPLSELPQPPLEFDEYQLQFYYEIGGALLKAKQLRVVDIPNLQNACFYYSACRISIKEMSQPDGLTQRSQNGFLQASPYVSVLEKFGKLLQQFADRYGLNLTGATKIPKAKSDRNSITDMFERK